VLTFTVTKEHSSRRSSLRRRRMRRRPAGVIPRFVERVTCRLRCFQHVKSRDPRVIALMVFAVRVLFALFVVAAQAGCFRTRLTRIIHTGARRHGALL